MELQGNYASTISGMTWTLADLPVISDSGLIDVDSGKKDERKMENSWTIPQTE
jgi:hypothetical protein